MKCTDSDDDDGFLRAVRDAPDDDALRLVYADWLDERGDPRGEFLRVEWELAGVSKADARFTLLEDRLASLRPGLDADWLRAVDRSGRPRCLKCGRRADCNYQGDLGAVDYYFTWEHACRDRACGHRETFEVVIFTALNSGGESYDCPGCLAN